MTAPPDTSTPPFGASGASKIVSAQGGTADQKGSGGTASVFASASAVATRAMSLFGASHIPRLGNIVLSAQTTLDAEHGTPDRIELRVFRADAPARAALATIDEARLRTSDGFIALVQVDLRTDRTPFPIDSSAARIARLQLCVLAPAVSDDDSSVARERLLQWLLATLVVHLNLASFARLTGDRRAFTFDALALASRDGSGAADPFTTWGKPWLLAARADVSDAEPGTFHLDLAAAAAVTGEVHA